MQKASMLVSDDLVEMIKEAANHGRIVLMTPTPGQPVDWLRIDHALAAPMRNKPSLVETCRRKFGLRRAEGRMFARLMVQDRVSPEELHEAISPDNNLVSNVKIVGVTLCRLRRKLKIHGIEIATIRGLGYQLTEEARDKSRKLLADDGAEAVAAAAPTGKTPSRPKQMIA